MALLHRNPAPRPAPAQQAAISARPAAIERPMADAVRALLADTGHGDGRAHMFADAATVLWTRFLSFDAADPHWPDRDRFVVSADALALLRVLLDLTGHKRIATDARRGPQLAIATNEEWRAHPAVAPSMGPPGQALASAIGLALAERLLAARFGKSLVDHRTWVIASDADLMSGIGHESGSFAGWLKLDRMAVLWAHPEAVNAETEDVLKRFAAYGWAVRRVPAGETVPLTAALSFAVRSRKPVLIALASPASRPSSARAGGDGRTAGMVGWRPAFGVSNAALARWRAAGERGSTVRRAWLKRAAGHPMRAEFERVMAGRLPDGLREVLAAHKVQRAARASACAPHEAAHDLVATLMPGVPELIAGAAPGAEQDPPFAATAGSIGAGNFRGRFIGHGIGDHGLAAAMNGVALHGGVIPIAESALTGSDAIRPALRLAAQSGRRVIHVLTQDFSGNDRYGGQYGRHSFGSGAPPPHQPAGHLASLRAVPDLYVYRPADAIETAECWELALRRADGPSLLVVSRERVPPLGRDVGRNACARGGYVLAEAGGARQATLIASGAEVAVAAGARQMLAADGIAVAVVSLPCWELFALQDEAYRAGVLGSAPRVGIEAALGFGWERWLGEDGWFLGLPEAGPGGAGLDLAGYGGLTAEAVAAALRKRLGRERPGETTDVQENRH